MAVSGWPEVLKYRPILIAHANWCDECGTTRYGVLASDVRSGDIIVMEMNRGPGLPSLRMGGPPFEFCAGELNLIFR